MEHLRRLTMGDDTTISSHVKILVVSKFSLSAYTTIHFGAERIP